MKELAIAYIRVSTDRQDEHSPETQFRNIQQYFDDKRWKKLNEKLEDIDIELDDRVILESVGKNVLNAKGCFGETGSAYNLTEERKEFNKMIKYAKQRKIRHLIFYRANRFSRNDEDWGVSKRLFRKSGLTDVFIHSIDRPQMVVHMFERDETEKRSQFLKKLIEAEEESYQKHIDATEGVKTKFEKGQLFYKPPYGFRTWTARRGDTKTHHVEVIEREMKQVHTMYDLVETGKYSLSGLQRELANQGIINLQREKPFSTRGLHSILTNVAYVGLIHRHGKTTKSSQFEAQIDKKKWQGVQKILSSRYKQKDAREGKTERKYASPYAGLMRCHYCGCGIVTDVTVKKYKSGNEQTFVYLRCTNGKRHGDPDFYMKKFGTKNCKQPYNREKNVIEEIDNQVSQLWFNDRILGYLQHQLKTIRITDENKKRKQIAALEKELDEFEVKKTKLFRGWEDDVIDNETYKTRMKQYKDQIENTKVLIQQVGQESDEIEEQIELSLELMEDLNNQWFTLKTAQKADILAILTEKIVLGKDGKDKPTIIWDMPFDSLFNIQIGSKGKRWCAQRDLNPRPSDS